MKEGTRVRHVIDEDLGTVVAVKNEDFSDAVGLWDRSSVWVRVDWDSGYDDSDEGEKIWYPADPGREIEELK